MRRQRYTAKSTAWYDRKLALAKTVHERQMIAQKRSERDRSFFRRETKRVLQLSGWTFEVISTWLNTPRPELDNLTPNEGLKIARNAYPYPKKVFHLLLADLKIKLEDIRLRDSVINFEDI